LLGTVEVETGESVNAIEARAEWGVYSKLKVPLHLYVPPACVDAVKRLCAEYQIVVAELWTYTTSFDQVRFTMVHRDEEAPVVRVPVKAKSAPAPRPAQARPEQVRAAKPIAPKATAAPTLRQAQGRPDQGRGTTKPKPVAKKAAPAKAKSKPKPAAKKARPAKAMPKKGAKKRR
jgi:hypothetical protein